MFSRAAAAKLDRAKNDTERLTGDELGCDCSSFLQVLD